MASSPKRLSLLKPRRCAVARTGCPFSGSDSSAQGRSGIMQTVRPASGLCRSSDHASLESAQKVLSKPIRPVGRALVCGILRHYSRGPEHGDETTRFHCGLTRTLRSEATSGHRAKPGLSAGGLQVLTLVLAALFG